MVGAAVRTIVATPLPLGDGRSDAYQRRVIVYPNRGELWDASSKSWYTRARPSGLSPAADDTGCAQQPASSAAASDAAGAADSTEATELFTPTDPELLALAEAWSAAGAALIGGCCRTTPETIKLLSVWGKSVPRHSVASGDTGARA